MSRRSAYARAGVDLRLGNQVKSKLPQLLAATKRPEVLGEVGGFGGLFALNPQKYRDPVLVASVDGVGTKLKLAFLLNRHDTIGQDLVNHCVNDIAVLGAEPLFFLDYLGASQLEEGVFEAIVGGFARACTANGCALIGGETAQMPGFYRRGEYDLSGTIVGVVERSKLLDGSTIRPGDMVIGVASSGLHTNGYSLARRILFDQMKLSPEVRIKGLRLPIGRELLKVHLSYGPLLRQMISKFNSGVKRRVIKGAAHITGGGIIDNLPRVLPANCNALIHRKAWKVPAVFKIIQVQGRLSEQEMYHVFNMGIGLTMIVSKRRAEDLMSAIKLLRHRSWIIGEVREGSGQVILD